MKISSLRNPGPPFSPRLKLVRRTLSVRCAVLSCMCRDLAREQTTLTFLDPEYSHDRRERNMLADSTLQELSRQTGISVRRSPAANIPLGQSGLIRQEHVAKIRLASSDPSSGNVSGSSGSAAELYDSGKTGFSSLPGECWRAFLLRLRRVKDPNGRHSIGIQLDDLTLIGVGVVWFLN